MPRGTLPLTVLTARGPPSRDQRAHNTRDNRPTIPRRQVLHFHTSACDKLTPPLHRTPSGPQAGRSPTTDTPTRAPSSRRPDPILSFDAIQNSFDASAVVHTRSSSRRIPDPITSGLSPERSPQQLLTAAAPGGLGTPPARRTRRANPHHWHSTDSTDDIYVTITAPSWTHDQRKHPLNVLCSPDSDAARVRAPRRRPHRACAPRYRMALRADSRAIRREIPRATSESLHEELPAEDPVLIGGNPTLVNAGNVPIAWSAGPGCAL